jgi:hypothetical protein
VVLVVCAGVVVPPDGVPPVCGVEVGCVVGAAGAAVPVVVVGVVVVLVVDVVEVVDTAGSPAPLLGTDKSGVDFGTEST